MLFENYTLSSASSINPNFCGFYANDDKVYYESQGNVTERIFFNHKVDFPYVKSTRIYNNGQKYKPLLVNYMTQFCTYDDQSYFFAPHGHYDNSFNDGYDLCGTAAQNFCPAILQDHLADVKSLGFDGVRFNGPELKVKSSGVLCVKLLRIHEHSQGKTYKTEHLVPLSIVKQEFIAEIKHLIDVCAMNGLKVNLFSGVDNTYHHGLTRLEYIAYLEELADELKLYDNLIAYTVALEPDLHFWDNDPQRDLQAIEKSALCSYYDDLYSAVKAKDPNHLITIGFSEMTTVLNYDPAVLKADFFTLHPYSSDRISIGEKWKRSVLWFSKSMKKLDKPWIIGESGAVGRDHSEPVPHGYGILGGLSMVGTEQQQTTYAIDAMNKTFGCGSCAFTWWSYKDFYWHKTNQTSPPSLKHTDFFGLYSHLGDEKNIIQSNVFNTYYPVLSYNNCAQPSNYYESPIANASYTYTGTIKDDNGVPIEDAIVIGLNYIYSTNSLIERNIAITNAQGEYKLYSDFGFNTLRVSAIGKEFVDEIGTLSTSNHKITSLSTINCSLLQSVSRQHKLD